MGFSTPLDEWFRGELKELSESLLLRAKFGLNDIFESRVIGNLWQEHQMRKADHGIVLWSMLMYQMWFERYVVAQEVTQQ